MADLEGVKVAKDYHVDVPFANNDGFYVKGANNLDWGMKKHLSNIFNPQSGNTVMFAFDHGYFMGSTAGLERLDLVIPKLLPYVDQRRSAFMRDTSVRQGHCPSLHLRFLHAERRPVP